ncbi:MAG: hypothetical protein NVSMB6_00060 [Burkholderiaceae bacterium]
MSVEVTIFQTLNAWSALAGVVITADRVEEIDAPPYVIFQKVTGVRVHSLQGDSGLANPHFQIDVYAETRAAAIVLRDEVRKAMLANPDLGAVHIAEGAAYEPDTKLFRERIDFSLWFYD